MEPVTDEEMTPVKGNFAGRNSGGDTSMVTSEGSTKDSPPVKEYDTPPDHVNDAVSDPHAALTPSSGRSRGQLRASSLSINPSIARAKNASARGRGSPKHLPPPIRTDAPAAIPIKLPGFSSLPNASDIFHTQPCAQLFQGTIPRLPVGDCENSGLADKHPLDINPYLHRADEIGPTHRISGVGHLGSALVPPGWKPGDEPIGPDRARELYQEARKAAVDAIDVPMSDEDDLSPEEREKRRKVTDRAWTLRFKTDELVLKERIEIHKQYHLRRISREQLHTLGLPGPGTPVVQQASQFPTPGEVQAFKHNITKGMGMPPPSPRGSTTFSGQVSPGGPRSTQFHGTSSMFPDAGTLDPALITESVAATLSRYKKQQEEILRKRDENEAILSAFLTQYKTELTGPISPGLRSPLTGAAAGPFASIHTGYIPKGSHQVSPRPLPYVSPSRPRFGSVGNLRSPTTGGPPPNMSAAELWQLVGCPKIPAGSELSRPIQPSGENAWASDGVKGSSTKQAVETNFVQMQVPPEKRKRARKAGTTDKEPAWYADQMVNLPTSEISAEAMATGEAWKQPTNTTAKSTQPTKPTAKSTPEKTAPKKKTPAKTPKKRGKKFDFDPAVGFPLDQKTAQLLLDRGLVKMSTRKVSVPGPSKPPGPTITDNADPVVRGAPSQMEVTASGAGGLVDSTKLSTAAQAPPATMTHQPTTNIAQLAVHDSQTPALSASHSTKGAATKEEGKLKQGIDDEGGDEYDEGSESMSSLDDPADKSWGNRRKTTTPRNRKSTGQKSKRSRLGQDGAGD